MSTGIVAALLPNMDKILGVRDLVGAVIQPVSKVTRTWYSDPGHTIPASAPEGYAVDVAVPLLPTPNIRQFSQDIRLKEGGAVKAGDLILKSVSKQSLVEADLDGSVASANIQKFYQVGVKLYQAINVVEKYVTFDVQIRELSNQSRYGI